MMVLIAGTGLFFKDPPQNWWPADVDPEHWDHRGGPQSRTKPLRRDPEA